MEIIKTLKHVPVLRILLPLILGISLGDFHTINNLLLVVFAFLFFLSSIIIAFVPSFSTKIRFQKYYGISISAFFLLFGMFLLNLKSHIQGTLEELSDGEKTYLISVKQIPQEKNRTFLVKTQVKAVLDSLYSCETKQGLILYIAKDDSLVKTLKPGNKLVIRAKLSKIKNKNNPDEFDYKRFINRRGYAYTTYLKKNDYHILSEHGNQTIEYKIAALRLSILNRLKKEFDEQTYAFLSSMLIGIKDDLDEETRNSFSASGITHLLAISGLHVGILYLVLTYLLLFLGNSPVGRLSRNIVIILVLWIYAMLAGLSPSVVRATIMFSVITIGNLLGRKTLIYNSLAFAALLMLLLNPNNLFEVGFQLSFLAVLGIVYFQPRIKKLLNTNNPVFSFLWGLVSVSIAAQLATFPLTIYYFHQFPNYFVVGNLLAIPLFFLNLILGLIYVAFGWIPVIGPVLQISTEFLSGLILKSSSFVSELRFSVTEGLTITKLQVVFIYLSLIFIAYFLSFRQGRYFLYAQLSLLFIIVINMHGTLQKRNQKELTVYNNSGKLVSYIDGFHSYNFADSVGTDEKNKEYALKTHLINQRVFKKSKVLLMTDGFDDGYFVSQGVSSKNSLVVFGKEKLLFLKEDSIQSEGKINIDYIILEDNVKATIKDLLKKFKFKKIVFAASNSSWNISSWKSECKELDIDYFSISDSGAFQIIH